MKWLAVHGIVNLFPPTENITIYSLLLQQTSDPTYTDTYTHARARATPSYLRISGFFLQEIIAAGSWRGLVAFLIVSSYEPNDQQYSLMQTSTNTHTHTHTHTHTQIPGHVSAQLRFQLDWARRLVGPSLNESLLVQHYKEPSSFNQDICAFRKIVNSHEELQTVFLEKSIGESPGFWRPVLYRIHLNNSLIERPTLNKWSCGTLYDLSRYYAIHESPIVTLYERRSFYERPRAFTSVHEPFRVSTNHCDQTITP